MITGAQAMVESLQAEGVTTLFGYPGAAILPFYDALARSNIRHILSRGEQGAGHAASGYARMTGSPGVCVTTSGPGATNLFTAIATAYSDSIPLVAITGQVATTSLGHDVFQEVDATGACEPFTKYAWLVKSADELPRLIKESFHIASTGRKGPVLIDVPVDVQRQLLDFSYPKTVQIRGYKPTTTGNAMQIRRVAQAINKAKRPLVCCGGGVLLSGAEEEVRSFCRESGLPVVNTMMGLGVFTPDDPLYVGMLGNGSPCANAAIYESDLLILIGARVGDRAIASPADLAGRTIVHIDIDAAEIGKSLGTTIPLVGDAKQIIAALRKHSPQGLHTAWFSRLAELKATDCPVPVPGLDPALLIGKLCRALPPGSVYVADVGQNQLWSVRHYNASGRFLTSGGMGTMGYSIPAAIGAKAACPHRTVVAVCGDGAFQMSLNELATAQGHSLPIKLVVLRNDRLGLVAEMQEKSPDGITFGTTLTGSPDISLIAAAYGIPHRLLEDNADIPAAVGALLADDQSFLLECIISSEVTAL